MNNISNISSQVIERAFGLLQKRFPRVTYLRQRTLKKKIKVVLAASVLHNLSIMEGDYFNGPLSEPEVCYSNMELIHEYESHIHTLHYNSTNLISLQDPPQVIYVERICTNLNTRLGTYKRNIMVEKIHQYNLAHPDPQ